MTLEKISIDPELAKQHIANELRVNGFPIKDEEIDAELAKEYIENEIAVSSFPYFPQEN